MESGRERERERGAVKVQNTSTAAKPKQSNLPLTLAFDFEICVKGSREVSGGEVEGEGEASCHPKQRVATAATACDSRAAMAAVIEFLRFIDFMWSCSCLCRCLCLCFCRCLCYLCVL